MNHARTSQLRPNLTRALTLALLGALAPIATAQTITVDITDGDAIDIDPNTATVADLPGPDGHISFSEAMIASNNTPGRQTIGFAIPTSEWTYLPSFYPGRAVIHGMMFYGNAMDEVTIDGTTQTAFTGDTNPAGREVVILRGGGLYIPANNCRITGLDNTNIYIEGSNAVVEDTSVMGIEISGVTGGSGAIVRRNLGGGNLKFDQSSNNTVVGSTFHRVRVLGWIAGGRPANNNRIGGPALADRNVITGLGTRNSQGIPGGSAVQLFNAVGTVIENNRIGTTPDGMAQGHPLTTIGVWFDTENYNTTIRGNQIAGILAVALPPHAPSYLVGSAIQLHGAGSGVTITGNTIGLDATGAPTLGSVTGIESVHFFYPNGISNVTIGGQAQGEGNEIAGHRLSGISIANTYSGVRISGNSIHDNAGLGIDLVTAGFLTGITLNDPMDADAGGNGLQNYPVLTAAASAGASTTVTGTLNSLPNQSFTVEFFANPACDASSHGEGKTFLGLTTITTNSAGNASFNAVLPVGVPVGAVIAALATHNATGNTSEFSECIAAAVTPACPGDADADGNVGLSDIAAIITCWGQSAACNPPADLDASGDLGLGDIAAVVTAWGNVCP